VSVRRSGSSQGIVEDSRDSSGLILVWSNFGRLVLSGLRKLWLVGTVVSVYLVSVFIVRTCGLGGRIKSDFWKIIPACLARAKSSVRISR
jgi:predicted benzoate:H+ symporter BenE